MRSLLLLAFLGFCVPACSSDPKGEDVEEQLDALPVASPAAAEIADAIAARAVANVDLHGATLLHKCSSRGNVVPRIRLEVHAFARTDMFTAPGAIVVRARGKRVVVAAEISLADGSGYYWNEDTGFALDGKSYSLSINDPEDYGYTESATTHGQVHFGCTVAPNGWGPWDQ